MSELSARPANGMAASLPTLALPGTGPTSLGVPATPQAARMEAFSALLDIALAPATATPATSLAPSTATSDSGSAGPVALLPETGLAEGSLRQAGKPGKFLPDALPLTPPQDPSVAAADTILAETGSATAPASPSALAIASPLPRLPRLPEASPAPAPLSEPMVRLAATRPIAVEPVRVVARPAAGLAENWRAGPAVPADDATPVEDGGLSGDERVADQVPGLPEAAALALAMMPRDTSISAPASTSPVPVAPLPGESRSEHAARVIAHLGGAPTRIALAPVVPHAIKAEAGWAEPVKTGTMKSGSDLGPVAAIPVTAADHRPPGARIVALANRTDIAGHAPAEYTIEQLAAAIASSLAGSGTGAMPTVQRIRERLAHGPIEPRPRISGAAPETPAAPSTPVQTVAPAAPAGEVAIANLSRMAQGMVGSGDEPVSAPTAAPPLAAAPDGAAFVTPSAPPAAASTVEMPAAARTAAEPVAAARDAFELASLIDRVALSRSESAAATTTRAAIQHAEFGRIAIGLNRDDGSTLSVTLSSADPAFASAARSAAGIAAVAASGMAPGGDAMGQSRQGSPEAQQGAPAQAQSFGGQGEARGQFASQSGGQSGNPQHGQARDGHAGAWRGAEPRAAETSPGAASNGGIYA